MCFDAQITFLYTKDLARAAAFYEDILGLTLVQVQDGGCRLYRLARGGFLGLCRERQGRVCSPEGLIFCMVTSDVENWYERLVAADVPIEKPPTYSAQFGIFHILFRDPDGHLLEIQRFDAGDWSEPWTGERSVT